MASVRDSLEVTIKSEPQLAQKRNAALVSLCRVLADQIDDAGATVSSRLTAAYLSALKDLTKAMGDPTVETGKGAAGGRLGQLRSVAAGSKSA